MARFRRALGHPALLLVMAFVTACGTTQTAQAPSPSPSPSPPAGTVTVHGKVFVADELSIVTCLGLFFGGFRVAGGGARPAQLAGCVGTPVRDGTEVAAYDDAAIPARQAVLSAQRIQAALAGLERLPKKDPKTVEGLRKALARAQEAKPTKVPGSAAPVATARTSNGNYSLAVPASFIGKNLLVCVTGQPATPNPNPGNPDIIGFCTTMTVLANAEGNTAVNQVNFLAVELSGDDNFIIDVRSAQTGQSVIGGVIGQREALDVVFARNVTTGLKAALDSPTVLRGTVEPCFYFEADSPFDSTYSGYGGTSSAQDTDVPSYIRVVTSLPQPNVYRFQGAVQWRSERTQDTPYTLWEFCGPDVFFMDPAQILVVQMSTNLGQAVTPFLAEVDEVAKVSVRQDTELPRFATGGLGTPATVPSGYGNYDRSDDRVHIPFSEPIIDASTDGVTFLLRVTAPPVLANWTMFVPASDTADWSKPLGDATNVDYLFDAHLNNWVSGGVHVDDAGVADTVVAARLHRMRVNTSGYTATDSNLVDGNSVLTRYSAGAADPWVGSDGNTFIVDKGGWQVNPGGANDAFLTFGGNVVP